MPKLRKKRFEKDKSLIADKDVIDKNEAIRALEILEFLTKLSLSPYEKSLLAKKTNKFWSDYSHSHLDTLNEIRDCISSINDDIVVSSPEKVYEHYKSYILSRFGKDSDDEIDEPSKILVKGEYQWVFKEYIYEVNGCYSDEQIRLLILEDFDKERRYFEKLKIKFDEAKTTETNYERPRIPEKVRIEVWRRDGGKCARCGGREKLEYDHIVPISKGGSNTTRNIELLCEKHNRSKSNNIV